MGKIGDRLAETIIRKMLRIFMQMKFQFNILTISGIVIIAFGTYLIYFGSKKDSDKSQELIALKLDSFERKLERTKSSNLTSIEKQKQIDTIEIQFDNWAKNLSQNSPEIKLAHDKELLTREEKKVLLEKKWNALLSNAFDDILKIVGSINKENPTEKINMYLANKMPIQDFFNEKKQFMVQLEFKSKMVLTIYAETSLTDHQLQSNDPDIYLHFVSFASRLSKNSSNLVLLSFFDQTHFSIRKYGSFDDFIIPNEKQYYSINELTKIIQEILAYQYLLPNKKS